MTLHLGQEALSTHHGMYAHEAPDLSIESPPCELLGNLQELFPFRDRLGILRNMISKKTPRVEQKTTLFPLLIQMQIAKPAWAAWALPPSALSDCPQSAVPTWQGKRHKRFGRWARCLRRTTHRIYEFAKKREVTNTHTLMSQKWWSSCDKLNLFASAPLFLHTVSVHPHGPRLDCGVSSQHFEA